MEIEHGFLSKMLSSRDNYKLKFKVDKFNEHELCQMKIQLYELFECRELILRSMIVRRISLSTYYLSLDTVKAVIS